MSNRERWAYEELQPGDVIQPGDEWQNEDGRWHTLVMVPGASTQLRDGLRARRPHNITALEKYRGDLISDIEHVIGERDEARAQGAKLSAELWARKPLEDRVSSLLAELTHTRAGVQQLQAERQEWIDRCNAEISSALQVSEQLTTAKDALKSAQRARDELQLQVEELRADRERLQGLIDNLLDEPTAKRVHSMLEDMLDQTEWVG